MPRLPVNKGKEEMYAQLDASELQTLKIISNPARDGYMPRVHLEKLLRLDLIEPSPKGVAVSMRGREILVKN
jgi:hypothetical protein